MEIGIVGLGIVGNVTYNILKSKHSLKILDPDKGFNNNISTCDIIFICINEKDPIMKNLDNLIDALVKTNSKAIFVIRTTVIPGTTDRYIKNYHRNFVYMPEFIREWNVEHDTFHPDKIVIGTENKKAGGILFKLFNDYFDERIILQIKPIEAEIAKLALNSLALIKVVFAEQICDLSKIHKFNYNNIYRVFSLDQNISTRHLYAGKDGYRGADGKCLPKDANFLANSSGASNMGLLKLAIELNKHYLKEGNNNERKSI